MAKLKVQLNHPGNQKPFKMGDGYSLWNEKIYREWNCGNHFRKFILNHCCPVKNLKEKAARR
jgi:hypothetical protein